ncbi:MAG TPA: DUF948 domain-containing protein [Clostridiaceae bacterium]|nr:DUF948 domain-containing protein [Clostridiaceae bacterium]
MSYLIVSEVTISLSELLSVLLYLAGIVAIVLLAVLFYRLAATFKKAKDLLDEMALPLTQTVNQLPDIIKKTDQTLADVNTITESAAKNIPGIIDKVADVTTSVGTTVETVADITNNVIGTVNNIFSKGKKAASGINLQGITSKFSKILGIIGFLRRIKRKHNKSRKKSKKKT